MIPPPLSLRQVFQDSSAYAALLDRRDENHAAARRIVGAISQAQYRLVTTNVILIEAHALILSNMSSEFARQFLRNVQSGNTLIVRVRARDEQRAQEVLFRYTDKDWSFADATSFVVMERLGMRYAFTFDSDFAQYGFTVLIPDLPLP